MRARTTIVTRGLTPELRTQRGQALIEFAGISIAATSLLFGLWLIARYQQLETAVVEASRFVAQQRAAVGDFFDDARSARLVQSEFLSERQSPLVATADVSVRTTRAAAERPGAFDRTVDAALFSGSSSPSLPAVDRATPYVANVEMRATRPFGLPAPLDRLDVTLRAATVISTNAWSAGDPLQVARYAARWVPTASARSLRPILETFGRVARFLPVDYLHELCVGRIDPEVVPSDRLSREVFGERGDWSAPC
ncbi:MAG: hypothetical protein WCE48_11565 [Steroidobacteraceae bacterium]